MEVQCSFLYIKMKGTMKKPQMTKRGSGEEPEVRFCTECGAVLDEFWSSETVKDLPAIRANMERCKHTGKFDGDFCSKLFIASSLGEPPTPPATPPKPAPRPRSRKK
jgi:hypothetical protein